MKERFLDVVAWFWEEIKSDPAHFAATVALGFVVGLIAGLIVK